MLRLLAPAVAVAAVIASGVVSGLQTDRWGLPPDIEAAAERLTQVPKSFGDWTSRELEMSAAQLEQAQAVGHLARAYFNQADGSRVDVLIVCGRHGPIAVHPPTVCFTGAGFQMRGAPERHVVKVKGPSTVAELWTTVFSRRQDGATLAMRTFWSWSNDGHWQAPDNPRITFAGSKPLYKMYVTRIMTGEPEDDSLADDASIRFLQAFVPELRKSVFTD